MLDVGIRVVGNLPDLTGVALDALDDRVRVQLIEKDVTVLCPQHDVFVARQDANRQDIGFFNALLELHLNVLLLRVLEQVHCPDLHTVEGVGSKQLVVCGHGHASDRSSMRFELAYLCLLLDRLVLGFQVD